ncbi:heparan-alpha-glucosaminide N-acetyltransferase domain-containing protein [Microbacterium esteraromaticum]|uniref:heparan-alpha-glucosaminide N-acetyltransferase domain-containing protein n=1 Tax=Microbacterium esteraromaticum TaxID=57043 RepID=UPI001C95CF36|nr:heparan-alpha-glucosaminide N-acetyltransferase domain-containing protein [Microbacterium esteraromaticum]MBY6062446.1 DUF1624 domain-containing protein [Microbacterium esteraromaticum]
MTGTRAPAVPGGARWWRSFGRPPRVMGLDVARALAIIGMMGAHVAGIDDAFALFEPRSWAGIVNGYPSLLFALLAGFSISLMTQCGRVSDAEIASARLRMLGRGVTIFVIGLLLEAFDTAIAIVLTLYGVLYLVLIPALRWRTLSLALCAAVLGLLGPVWLAVLAGLPEDAMGPVWEFLLRGSYPITVWLFFALIGMALGRLQLHRSVTAWGFVLTGTVLLVAAHLVALVPVPDRLLQAAVFDISPHSRAMVELVAALGLGLLVVGVCLWASHPLRLPLLPVAALGSMPLTAYTAHVVSYFVMAGPDGRLAESQILLWSTIILVVACTLWSALIGRGPLETLAARAGDAAAMLRP